MRMNQEQRVQFRKLLNKMWAEKWPYARKLRAIRDFLLESGVRS